jgi:hypothetical protein
MEAKVTGVKRTEGEDGKEGQGEGDEAAMGRRTWARDGPGHVGPGCRTLGGRVVIRRVDEFS